jgi:dipeptidyl aminopeptidase/acylaminoacyl peptidase
MKRLCAALVLAAGIVLTLAGPPLGSATFPGRNGLIAYTGFVGGGSTDIFTVDPRSGVVTRLTNMGDASRPSWSPDGRRIAFGTRTGIYVMNADGSDLTRLTARGGEPAWSPDGRIVFSSGHLFTIDANGTNLRQLTFGAGTEDEPAWSPDGKKIVYGSEGCGSFHDFWILNVANGSTECFFHPINGAYNPKWSPDGTKILYTASTEPGAPEYLAWFGVNSAAQGSLSGDYSGAFSPDGTTYTYTLVGNIYVSGDPVPFAAGSEPDWGVTPPVCLVPRLKGRTVPRARILVQRFHCALGHVFHTYSPVRRGRIVSQRPRAGSVRTQGTRVSVTVSRGRRP